MQLPLITVRIPAYNHERFVAEALDSVRLQSYPNKEVVIIDDGSTDRTAAVVAAWIEQHGDEIPVRFHSRPNRGVSATLNELIDMARGEYLVGLASDDKLLPGSLQARYDYLQAHPEKMAVFGDSQVIDSDGNVVFSSGLADLHSANKTRFQTDRGLKKEIIQNWSVTGSVIMVRRALHERFRYDEELAVEDRDFYLKLVADNILGFVDARVSAYRIHGANACFDQFTRRVKAVNKYRSLRRNMVHFSLRDKVLFVRPLAHSIAGIIVCTLMRW